MLTDIPDSWAWMRPDLVTRLLPLTLACAAVYLFASRPGWFGLSPGRLGVQLLFGLVMAPVMFASALAVQLWLARRRGSLLAPATSGDAIGRASCRERV